MQKQNYEKLYGIFGSNVINFSLNSAVTKIKTKDAGYYKKALAVYVQSKLPSQMQSMI